MQADFPLWVNTDGRSGALCGWEILRVLSTAYGSTKELCSSNRGRRRGAGRELILRTCLVKLARRFTSMERQNPRLDQNRSAYACRPTSACARRAAMAVHRAFA